MRKFTSFLAGALMGALVGATLALLFTPMPGDEIRKTLQERVQDLQREAQEAAAARRAELEEQLKALRAPQKAG